MVQFRQTATPYAIRYGDPKTVRLGPWNVLHETDHPAENAKRMLTYAQNTWFRDLDGIPVVRGRPSLAALGSNMGGLGQCIDQLTKVDGTEYTFAIIAGEIWTYNWGTATWTKVVTTANLTTAAITLSATVNIYATPFANTVVITDGVNTAFTWDGTSGAGGLTKLTNAPVFYGPTWVYYGQLFGVKNTAKNTLVWSEVGTPNTGYEAGGYNNAWDLRQTSNETITALGATNSMLAIIRPNSSTSITGEVTDNFASTGTQEAIDAANGTVSVAGTLVHDTYVYVYSADGRILRTNGGSYQDVASGLRMSLANRNTSELDNVRGVVWDAGQYGERLLIGFPEISWSNRMTAFACINPATGAAEGIWRGFHASAMGVVKDGSGNLRVAILSGSTATSITNGYAYVLGMADDTAGLDAFAGGNAAVSCLVKPAHAIDDDLMEKRFIRVDVSSTSPTGMTDITLGATTPYGTTTIGTFDIASSAGTYWNQFLWNQANWAGAQKERKASIRTNRQGRWCQFSLTHATANEVFSVQSLTTQWVPTAPMMGAP